MNSATKAAKRCLFTRAMLKMLFICIVLQDCMMLMMAKAVDKTIDNRMSRLFLAALDVNLRERLPAAFSRPYAVRPGSFPRAGRSSQQRFEWITSLAVDAIKLVELGRVGQIELVQELDGSAPR